MDENSCVEMPFVMRLCDTLIIIIASHLGFVLGCDTKTITCTWVFTNSLQSDRVWRWNSLKIFNNGGGGGCLFNI